MAISATVQTPTVESVNGTPAALAAFAACASPRRAYMPAKPTGESTTGIESFWPNSSVSSESSETSFSTRCRSFSAWMSATLAASVSSA